MPRRSEEEEEEEEETESDENVDGWKGKKIIIRVINSMERRDKLEFGRSCGTKYFCCQADECGTDLSSSKTYHRRHKVCERHSKAPIVLVKGRRQRFCQQCSRFHEVSQFDNTKRSCRNRLAGHNQRRRKSNCRTAEEGWSLPPTSEQEFAEDCGQFKPT